jgi:arylsulfatase A-like enzyme
MPSYGYVSARYGFDDGFSLYHHAPHAEPFRSSWIVRRVDRRLLFWLNRGVGNGRAQTDSVLRFLRSGRREPFFAFLHYYDVHSKFDELPYDSPDPDRFCEGALESFEGCAGGHCASDRLLAISRRESPAFDEQELEVVRCLYDGGIAFVDAQLARVFRALEEEDIADETVVVVTSDHGEAFLEHRNVLHLTLHEEVARVPLIIKLPGGAAGRRVWGPVGLADVAPTLLELAGASAEPTSAFGTAYGSSLLQILTSWHDAPDDAVLAIDRDAERIALRVGNAKLIRPVAGGQDELFDLEADAGEHWNRASSDPAGLARLGEVLEALRGASESARSQLRGAGSAPATVELSPAEREALRALGYVQEAE